MVAALFLPHCGQYSGLTKVFVFPGSAITLTSVSLRELLTFKCFPLWRGFAPAVHYVDSFAYVRSRH
jgi:hypothetical protein